MNKVNIGNSLKINHIKNSNQLKTPSKVNVQFTTISDLKRIIKKIKISKYFKVMNFFKIYENKKLNNQGNAAKHKALVEIEYYSKPVTFKVWRKYNNIKGIILHLLLGVFLLIPSLFYLLATIIYIVYFTIYEQLMRGKKRFLNLKPEECRLDGISFIIPTWNKRDMVVKCIKLLDQAIVAENQGLNCEIIVVDNGSKDGTYQALLNLSTKTKLEIIKNEINLGYAKGINEAVDKSKYNYVYLLNNDMEVQNGFLASLISFAKNKIDKSEKFFGLASQIFFFDPKKRREESGKTYCQPKAGFINIAHVVSKQNLTQNSITLYPGGGSSLINKHVFNKLGQYDYKSYTPLYCEDLDLGYLAWKYGYPSYFISKSHVIHHHQSSTKKLNKDPTYFLYKNLLVFILKNFTSPKVILKHTLLFVPQLIVNTKYTRYALETIKNIHNIFASRLKLAQYQPMHTDQQLENFILFEAIYKDD